jgi:hypothetical protein
LFDFPEAAVVGDNSSLASYAQLKSDGFLQDANRETPASTPPEVTLDVKRSLFRRNIYSLATGAFSNYTYANVDTFVHWNAFVFCRPQVLQSIPAEHAASRLGKVQLNH